LQSNYPEVLKHSFVINAPKIFNALFNIVKPLLNSRTLAKVQIFNSDKPRWKEALLKLIPEEQIPPHWGGTMKGADEYCSDAWFFEPMPKYFMRKTSSAVDEFGGKLINGNTKINCNFSMNSSKSLNFSKQRTGSALKSPLESSSL